MPRLTPSNYLHHRHRIHLVWFTPRLAAHTLISVSDQHARFAFYRPTDSLTDEQALAHRAAISRQQPTLPSRAGKAYRRFMSATRVHDEQRQQPRQKVDVLGRRLSVRAIRRVAVAMQDTQ